MKTTQAYRDTILQGLPQAISPHARVSIHLEFLRDLLSDVTELEQQLDLARAALADITEHPKEEA